MGSFCPHYDGEPQRRPSFQRMVLEGRLGDGLAADNGAAAHFVDGQLAQVVSSVPDARVYRVFRQGAQVCEMAFEARYLGAAGAQT